MNDGIKFMLIASFCFSIMGAFAKALSPYMNSIEIVFFRNLAGIFLIALTFYNKPIKQVGGKFWLLTFRGLMGFLALLAWFYNVGHISLADALTFSKLSPILTAIFAFWFLGEKAGNKAWLAVILGFIGIIFIIKPNGLSFSKTDLLGLFSGVGAALAYTSVRELRRYYDTRAIVLSFMIVGTLGPLILMIISEFYTNASLDFMLGKFSMPNQISWIYILGLGFFATIAQTYMTKAYAAQKAGIVGAVSYSDILFSMILGIMMGDNFPDILGFLGIILVISGGVLVAFDKKE